MNVGGSALHYKLKGFGAIIDDVCILEEYMRFRPKTIRELPVEVWKDVGTTLVAVLEAIGNSVRNTADETRKWTCWMFLPRLLLLDNLQGPRQQPRPFNHQALLLAAPILVRKLEGSLQLNACRRLRRW